MSIRTQLPQKKESEIIFLLLSLKSLFEFTLLQEKKIKEKAKNRAGSLLRFLNFFIYPSVEGPLVDRYLIEKRYALPISRARTYFKILLIFVKKCMFLVIFTHNLK